MDLRNYICLGQYECISSMHPIRNQTIDLGVLKALDPGTGHDVARDGYSHVQPCCLHPWVLKLCPNTNIEFVDILYILVFFTRVTALIFMLPTVLVRRSITTLVISQHPC